MEKFLYENELIREDKIKGEIQINYFRIGMLIAMIGFLIMIEIRQKAILLADKVHYVNITIGLIYSIIFLYYLYKNKYFLFLTYVSATFDIFLVTITLYFSQYAYNSSVATTPLIFGTVLYYVEIIISVRRHNFYNTIYTAVLAFFSYLFIIIYMYRNDAFFNLFISERGNLVMWLDLGNEISKAVIILVTGYISAYISRNFDVMFYKGIMNEIEKENIKNVFGRYLSNEVVDKVLKGEIKFDGEKRTITVMFIDIKNFTTLSEKIKPELLLKILNTYFQIVIDIVQNHDGYINKFLGDGVLIFFGAPVDNESHREDAVRCAIDILNNIKNINEKIKTYLNIENVSWSLDIGIGINTGSVVIGNIGSEDKLEYTAIGDTVNTAERIEKMTRKLSKKILINHTVLCDFCKDLIEETFNVKVKGKNETLKLYSLKLR